MGITNYEPRSFNIVVSIPNTSLAFYVLRDLIKASIFLSEALENTRLGSDDKTEQMLVSICEKHSAIDATESKK